MTKKRTGLRAKLFDEISMSRGDLRIADNLMKEMGMPEFVALLWGVKGEIIGIMPKYKKAEDTYRLRRRNKMSCGEVGCKRFLAICGLTAGKQYRIPAQYDKTHKMIISALQAPKLPPGPAPSHPDSKEVEEIIRKVTKRVFSEIGLFE